MKFKLAFVGLSLLLMFGCSKSLVHTWNIDIFEIIKDNGQKTGNKNIGTITFNKNGTGNKDIHYSIFEHEYEDKTSFKWESQDGYILIKPTENNDRSKLNKVWIIVQDEAKKQVWKSTDGKHQVEILELSRN